MKIKASILILFLSPFISLAQVVNEPLKKGNLLYAQDSFAKAEGKYREALTYDSTSRATKFNLGDALYKQGKYKDAAKAFQDLTFGDTDKDLKAKAFHNLGNSNFQLKKYQESVEAYKQGLKLNPKDEQTRRNLSQALRQLQIQQQQQQQEQQKQQEQSTENEENQHSESNPNEEESEPDNKDESTSPEEKEEETDLDKLMKKLEENEEKLRDQLDKNRRPRKQKQEKDW